LLNWRVNIIDQDHQSLLRRDVEEDTKILSTKYFRADGIPYLLERWRWESVHASTAVLLTKYVSAMDDDNLKKFLTEKAGIDLGDGGATIVRCNEHVFFNFGFEAE